MRNEEIAAMEEQISACQGEIQRLRAIVLEYEAKKPSKPAAEPKAEALESMSLAELRAKADTLYSDIRAVPKRRDLHGRRFTWAEGCKDLQIVSPGQSLTYSLDKTTGDISYYSFHSMSSEQGTVACAVEYFKRCAGLLSDEFRAEVLADYQDKKERLHNLETQLEAVNAEIKRRERA
jgi:hypothetical protein